MRVGINLMVTTFFTLLILGKPLTPVVNLHSNLKCKVLRLELDGLNSVFLGWF